MPTPSVSTATKLASMSDLFDYAPSRRGGQANVANVMATDGKLGWTLPNPINFNIERAAPGLAGIPRFEQEASRGSHGEKTQGSQATDES